VQQQLRRYLAGQLLQRGARVPGCLLAPVTAQPADAELNGGTRRAGRVHRFPAVAHERDRADQLPPGLRRQRRRSSLDDRHRGVGLAAPRLGQRPGGRPCRVRVPGVVHVLAADTGHQRGSQPGDPAGVLAQQDRGGIGDVRPGPLVIAAEAVDEAGGYGVQVGPGRCQQPVGYRRPRVEQLVALGGHLDQRVQDRRQVSGVQLVTERVQHQGRLGYPMVRQYPQHSLHRRASLAPTAVDQMGDRGERSGLGGVDREIQQGLHQRWAEQLRGVPRRLDHLPGRLPLGWSKRTAAWAVRVETVQPVREVTRHVPLTGDELPSTVSPLRMASSALTCEAFRGLPGRGGFVVALGDDGGEVGAVRRYRAGGGIRRSCLGRSPPRDRGHGARTCAGRARAGSGSQPDPSAGRTCRRPCCCRRASRPGRAGNAGVPSRSRGRCRGPAAHAARTRRRAPCPPPASQARGSDSSHGRPRPQDQRPMVRML